MKKTEAAILMSDEMLHDARPLRESFAVAMSGTRPRHRMRSVWMDGYRAAIEDIRSGRMRFDSHMELVPGVKVA